MLWGAVIGLVAFTLLVVFLVDASRRLLEIQVDRGRVVKLEGRAPGELLHDVEDVLERSRVSGKIIVRLEGGRAAVHVSGGIDDGTAQRLRNVVGRFPTARLKTARHVRR